MGACWIFVQMKPPDRGPQSQRGAKKVALTATQVKTAQAKEKDYKLSDEKGLYLLVRSSGRKYWKMKYRFAGKEKKLSLGVYPENSLKDAREGRDEARNLLKRNIDPSAQKQIEKFAVIESVANSCDFNNRTIAKGREQFFL